MPTGALLSTAVSDPIADHLTLSLLRDETGALSVGCSLCSKITGQRKLEEEPRQPRSTSRGSGRATGDCCANASSTPWS